MPPAGAVPNVPAVAPPPSAVARSLALAASRPMTSTELPPSTARAPTARAMPPRPIMLMLLMVCLLPDVLILGMSLAIEFLGRIRPGTTRYVFEDVIGPSGRPRPFSAVAIPWRHRRTARFHESGPAHRAPSLSRQIRTL